MKILISLYRKLAVGILTGGIWAASIGSANALVITQGAGPSDFSFSGIYGAYNLAVTGSLDLAALSATSATLNIVLTNASTLAGGGAIATTKDVRLSAFGFGINPNANAVSFSDANDGGMVGASLSQIPSLAQIEVCAFGGPNCSGGGSGGLWAGDTDTFTLILTGNFSGLNALTFDPLGVKFQTNAGSYEFACADSNCGGNPVPEPASLALLGLGLLGFAASRRKANKN